jgi:8-oxo-dGTP diphosphatase
MTQSADEKPVRPEEVVARRVRELRTDRGWSAQRLGEELTKAGLDWDRNIVANLETGRRRVISVSELLTLAYVLDVALVHLLVPTYPQPLWNNGHGSRTPDDPNEPNDSAPYQVTPNLVVSCHEVRQFVRAYEPLPGQDPWKFYEQVPPHERVPREELKRRAAEAARVATVTRLPPPAPQTVIAGIVTSDRGVLVTRRVDQNPPWGFTAGWGEPGESPEDTIIREVKEEADLRIEVGEYLGERDHPATGKHMIYYAARPTHGTEIHLGDKGELTEVRWVSLAEADELMGSVPGGIFGPVREHLARELGEG